MDQHQKLDSDQEINLAESFSLENAPGTCEHLASTASIPAGGLWC